MAVGSLAGHMLSSDRYLRTWRKDRQSLWLVDQMMMAWCSSQALAQFHWRQEEHCKRGQRGYQGMMGLAGPHTAGCTGLLRMDTARCIQAAKLSGLPQ